MNYNIYLNLLIFGLPALAGLCIVLLTIIINRRSR
jgi:hypothetical protein